MGELIKIYRKIQGFFTFVVLFETWGCAWLKKVYAGLLNVSGTNWKNFLRKPWENDYFPPLTLFFHLPSQKCGTLNYFQSARIELSACKVLF